MALLEYTFDSPENPGLNRSIDFYNGYLAYQNGMKELHNQMNKVKKHLQMTQSFTENNFNDREGTPEGSPEYQQMAKAFQDTLDKIKNPEKTPAEIEKSILALAKKTDDFCKSAKDTNDPTEKSRLLGANVLKNNLPQIINVYRQLRRNVSMVSNETGENYMNLPLSQVKAKAFALEKEHEDDLEDMPNWKSKPDFQDAKKVSDAQVKLRTSMYKLTKTFVSNFNTNKGIDDYMTLKPKMSMTDMAKYYLCKKKMDEIHQPGITPAEARTIVEGFNPAKFKKEYEALAKNPNFIRCVKQNPKNGFSKWESIQLQTDVTVKAIENEKKNEGYQRTSHFMVEKYAKKIGFSYMRGAKQNLAHHLDNLYQDAANLMVQDILTNPKNRYVAESITMNPAERQLLQASALETLKKGKIFDNVTPQKATMRLNHLQEDPTMMESAVKSFNQKREAMQKQEIANKQIMRIRPKQQIRFAR